MTAPQDFARSFAAAWVAGDSDTLEAALTDEATMLTLTGLWCEGRAAILAAMRAERAGTLSRARLVGGRAACRDLAPGVAMVAQRMVVSGLSDAGGQDLGRIAAMLTATLTRGPQGWQAQAVTFAPVSEGQA